MTTDVTPFSEQVAYLAKGQTNDEATEKLAELIKAVRLTGKKGTLTLTVEVSMLDKASEDAMRIVGRVKSKPPELEQPTTVMFSTGDGDLLRDDPEQRRLDLRQVTAEPAPSKRVEPTTKTPKSVSTGD